MKDFNLLPSDEETAKWFDENIGAGCSASSGIYKFRLWLKERRDLKTAFDKAEKTSQEFIKIEPQPKYEFEIYCRRHTAHFKVGEVEGWYPIETNRIRKPEKIEEYIKEGVLRRIKYAIFRTNTNSNRFVVEDGIIKWSTDKEELEKICEEMNKNKPDSWHDYQVYETDGTKALMRGEVVSR